MDDPHLDKCRSCGLDIIWCLSPAGKRMPLDARPVEQLPDPKPKTLYWIEDGDPPQAYKVDALGTMEPDIRRASHFATCAQARQWSGRGGR